MKILFINFCIFLLQQFEGVHSGKMVQKLKSSAAIGVTISPIALIFQSYTNWFFSEVLFMTIIGVALLADLLLGMIAHAPRYLDDFDLFTMLWKFMVKFVVCYTAIFVFGLFVILFHSYGLNIGIYTKLAASFSILCYPALSALGNMSIVTGGAFPPKDWIMALESKRKKLMLGEFLNNKKDENNY